MEAHVDCASLHVCATARTLRLVSHFVSPIATLYAQFLPQVVRPLRLRTLCLQSFISEHRVIFVAILLLCLRLHITLVRSRRKFNR